MTRFSTPSLQTRDSGRAPARVAQWSRLLGVAALLLVFAGCASPLKQWGAETSLRARAADFDAAQLEQARSAVLTAVVSFGFEGYAHQVSRSLFKALTQDPLHISVLSPQMSLSRINRADLAADYTAMMAAYQQSGILNRATLGRLGEVLQSPYVFLPTLAWFDQMMSERFNFFGVRILQTRISILRLSLEIWDTRTGEIAWESSGEATLAGEDVREYRIPFEEIAEHLWATLLADLQSRPAVPVSPGPPSSP